MPHGPASALSSLLNGRLGRAQKRVRAAFWRRYLDKGPGRPCRSLDAYRQEHPERWHEAYPAVPTPWTKPRHFGDVDVDATVSEWLKPAFPAVGVVEIEGAMSFGVEGGWTRLPDGTWLPELTWPSPQPLDSYRLPARVPPPIRLEGTALNLMSWWCTYNYFHFLIDALPRFHVFQRAGFRLSDVDHIILPPPPSDHARTVMRRLGVPEEKVVHPHRNRPLRADRMLVPTYPGAVCNYPGWVSDVHRASIDYDAIEPNRRLYITRRGQRRRLLNEDAVVDLLSGLGFEVYDPGEHPDQYLDFAAADVVVAAHGAALTNLAFCRPGTRVLEIVPTDNAFPYFQSLSQSGGLDYATVGAQSTGETPRPWWDNSPSYHDFHVELDPVAEAAETFLRGK